MSYLVFFRQRLDSSRVFIGTYWFWNDSCSHSQYRYTSKCKCLSLLVVEDVGPAQQDFFIVNSGALQWSDGDSKTSLELAHVLKALLLFLSVAEQTNLILMCNKECCRIVALGHGIMM